MTRERCRCDGAGFFGSLCLDGACTEIAKHNDAAFADDFFANLVNGGEHAADTAGDCLIGYGAVRDGEMSFFSKAVAIELELNVFHPGGWSTIERSLDQRAQDVPDFRPAFLSWPPQKLRVLGAEDGAIGVVIKLTELRSPPEEHWKTVDEHEARHRF